MKTNGIFYAALLGLTVAAGPLALLAPNAAQADQLRIIAKDTSETLSVAQNRAVVVESEVPFAELSDEFSSNPLIHLA